MDTIIAVKEARSVAEKTIMKAIIEFQIATGFNVTYVDYQYERQHDNSQPISVRLHIELP